MAKKALAGFWTTCVFFALQVGTAQAAASDIVMYASDAANVRGNWTLVADATAAGGQRLASADNGWSNTTAPAASPADYVEFTFTAAANTPYHVWFRLRATANSKLNDSVFAQYSDAVDASGTQLYPIGTTSGLTVNLATDAGASSLNGWGWQDGAYWLAQSTTVRFASSGPHTLRVQTREDGVSLDQVVVSPLQYLSKAPGVVTNDTTILPRSSTSTPFLSGPAAVPGTLQAANFDNGGEGVAYHDTTAGNAGGSYRQTDVDLAVSAEGGYCVGWISATEWLGYSVNVASAGTYLFEARVASLGPGGTFHLESGGVNLSGPLTVPNTGDWQTWATVSKTITLNAGTQTLKVVFDTAGPSTATGNLSWMRFTAAATSPYTGVAAALPGTIHGENFDNGGEGVGYHDTTPGNSGGAYRQTDVDIQASSFGGYNIGCTADGEWLAYTVNVAAAGVYSVQFQVASPFAGGQIHATFGSTSTAPVRVPSTGDWQNWSTVSVPVTLSAGPQVMTVVFDAGGFNLGGIVVAATTVPPPAAPTSPNPAGGASGISTSASLSWSSQGATAYDVGFGATQPPPTMATGLATASFSAAGLTPGATYFWQITAHNAGGTTVGAVWSFTVVAGTRTWAVNAGDDLQAAINSAQPGDTILLQPGATFAGNFVLPVKDGSSYVTIRSAASDAQLPGATTRIDPSYSPLLPKLRSSNSMAVMSTAPGAHHYRLMFLEFLANVQGLGDILDLGDGSQSTLAVVPHDLVIDRVYMHGDVTYGQKRAIGLNSASTSVLNSYISEIKAPQQDSQAICGWNGPGPYTITNNYLEAASENVMFGGADPTIPNLVPSDITMTHNHLAKQPIWQSQPNWNVKNLFELKNVQRIVVDGNIFEYNWLNAQVGYSIVFTPRNQDGGAPWSIVQDVQFTNNIVRHVAAGVSILGQDYLHPSQLTNHIVVRNNVFEDISSATYGGTGWFMLIQGGDQVTVDHNTVFQDGTSVLYADSAQTTGFAFTNNIVPPATWTIFGTAGIGNPAIAGSFPQSVFLDNVFAGTSPVNYPTGNYYPATTGAVGFVNIAGEDYHLSAGSPYLRSATDGTDIGCNIDALNVALGAP